MFLVVDTSTKKDYYPGFGNFVSQQISVYAACVIFGAIFSFFTWILFVLIIKGIITCFSQFRQLKLVIALIGVGLTIGTFALALPETFNIHNEFFFLMLANCACIAGSSYFYHLEITQEPDIITN